MTKTATERFESAERRWAGIGPYYAMFPMTFAEHVIKKYTAPGDVVLDPFAGRGTAVYAAAMHSRHGLGIEINPVGWVYAKAKLQTADRSYVIDRLQDLANAAPRYWKAEANLPEFFRRCYCSSVLRFLLAARANLDWRFTKVDWTVMALLLVHLHGKRTDSLSNQMRQTKAMSPRYAMQWWKRHRAFPPDIEPVEFMNKKLKWRYAKGTPALSSSQIYLGDSVNRLATVETALPTFTDDGVKLLLTSPPYCGVTNYHYDQWIRLWLLGGSASPTVPAGRHRGKFVDRTKYKLLLDTVFRKAKPLLRYDAVVYVRTDNRAVTRDITEAVLRDVFPEKRLYRYLKPRDRRSQTWLFRKQKRRRAKVMDNGDVDMILLP